MKRAKHPKKEDLLEYTNEMLYDYWPEIMKKLGLDVNAFEIPRIKLCKKGPHCDSEFPTRISLDYDTVLKAYKNKHKKFQVFDIPYESLCLEDVIHETVHYIQDGFYDIYKDEFVCATEGVSLAVSLDIILKSGEYKNPATAIADMFHKANAEYNHYFDLPQEYNEHIEKVLKDERYKPQSFKVYACGFVYICKYYYPSKGNFLELLIDPFSDEECYTDLGLR